MNPEKYTVDTKKELFKDVSFVEDMSILKFIMDAEAFSYELYYNLFPNFLEMDFDVMDIYRKRIEILERYKTEPRVKWFLRDVYSDIDTFWNNDLSSHHKHFLYQIYKSSELYKALLDAYHIDYDAEKPTTELLQYIRGGMQDEERIYFSVNDVRDDNLVDILFNALFQNAITLDILKK